MGSDTTADRKSGTLKQAWFHILLALADGAQHGYAIRKSVRERTEGAVKLYPDPDEDQCGRYYRLTPAGRDALADEVGRMQAILDQARATRALSSA